MIADTVIKYIFDDKPVIQLFLVDVAWKTWLCPDCFQRCAAALKFKQ